MPCIIDPSFLHETGVRNEENSIIGLLFVMFCCYVKPSICAQSLRTPEQVLEQTFSNYAQFVTYQDQGWAEKVVKGNKGGSYISTTTSFTIIKRPDNLKIEWHDSRFAEPEQRRSVSTSNLQGVNLFLAWTNRFLILSFAAVCWVIRAILRK